MKTPIEEKEILLNNLDKYTGCKKRWEKSNAPYVTRLLKNSNVLMANIVLDDDELPLTEYYVSETDYLIFTTRAIYSQKDENKLKVRYKTLFFTSNDIVDKNSINQLFQDRKQNYFVNLKFNLDNGKTFDMTIENGSPLAVYLLLLTRGVVWDGIDYITQHNINDDTCSR